jgi:hypothetical protein
MKLLYNIDELVDSRNKSLYDNLCDAISFEIKNSNEKSWTSKLEDVKAIICIRKSTHPVACFTHELLHMKYELQGMSRPFIFGPDNDIIGQLAPHLYNEFAHHKFYKEYILMGFPPEEFLGDSDLDGYYKTLRRDVYKMNVKYQKFPNQLLDGLIVALPYLMYLSPNQNPNDKPKSIKTLEKISNNNFLESIKLLVEEVQNSESNNLSIYFAKFFKLCGLLNYGFSLIKDPETFIWSNNV